MSYFRVQPNVLRAQSEELETVYGRMCREIAEISNVIQRLQTMTEFDEVISSLRKTQQKGMEQSTELRQCARMLEQVAELYRKTEEKNLDGAVPSIRPVQRVISSTILTQAVTAYGNSETGQAEQIRQLGAWDIQSPKSTSMLSFAKELLGNDITISPNEIH